MALATDTGSFKFDMTTPAVHELAARLIGTGISPGEISRRIFDTRPFGAMKLVGEVLGRAAPRPHGRRWARHGLDVRHAGRSRTVRAAAVRARNADRPVRSVAEADVAVVVKELAAGEWAVSLRSKGAVDVSQVAVAFGGGGHRLAAGFTGHGTPGDVVVAVREELVRNGSWIWQSSDRTLAPEVRGEGRPGAAAMLRRRSRAWERSRQRGRT